MSGIATRLTNSGDATVIKKSETHQYMMTYRADHITENVSIGMTLNGGNYLDDVEIYRLFYYIDFLKNILSVTQLQRIFIMREFSEEMLNRFKGNRPGDKEVSHKFKDGKLYHTQKIMGFDGKWIEHEFEFDGTTHQKLIDANIQVGQSTFRDRSIDFIIYLLEKCKSKHKYVTTDAESTSMPFGNIFDGFDTLNTKMPLSERIQVQLAKVAELRWKRKSSLFKKALGHVAYRLNNLIIRITAVIPDDSPKVYDYDMYDKYYDDLIKYNEANGNDTDPEEYDTVKYFFDETKIDDSPGINVPITDEEGNVIGWKKFEG